MLGCCLNFYFKKLYLYLISGKETQREKRMHTGGEKNPDVWAKRAQHLIKKRKVISELGRCCWTTGKAVSLFASDLFHQAKKMRQSRRKAEERSMRGGGQHGRFN